MSIRGHCTICTSTFTQTTVFALPCGHTFHKECIEQWLNVKERSRPTTTPSRRGCPNCRRECRSGDVTRIFFEAGLNDTQNSTSQRDDPIALQAKNDDLQSRLDDAIADASKAKKDLSAQLNERAKLESSVAVEKESAKKATRKLKLKEAELSQIRSMLHDVNETKHENQLLKQQVEASLFYKELFHGSKPLEAIQYYINDKGNPDEGKFLELQARAREAEKKRSQQLAKEVEAKNKKIAELDMEKKQLQEALRLLTEECKNQGVTTPQNPRVKKLLAMSPPRRDSLDVFNGSINDKVVKSAMRGRGPVANFTMEKPTKATWSEEKKKWMASNGNSSIGSTRPSITSIDLRSPNVDVFDKISVPTAVACRVINPVAKTTKNLFKSVSDGMGGSIHRPGDRILSRIENSLPTSSLAAGRERIPFGKRHLNPSKGDDLVHLAPKKKFNATTKYPLSVKENIIILE